MFSGEASISFKTNKQMESVITTVKDLLRSLGSVRINNRGTIEISPSEKYQTLLVDSTISGELKQGQASGEYTIRIDY